MTLTIFIINYNTGELVNNCIKSIYNETTTLDFEIVVFDNASKEDITPFLYTFPEVKLIKNNQNIGFGRANNIGIEQANSEYILLLNSDTIVLDNAIGKSVNFIKNMRSKDETVGLIGCRLLYENGEIQKSVFFKGRNAFRYFIHSNPILSRIFRTKHPYFDYECKQPKEVNGISGAFMLFHRDIFKKIKPFDPDIFMYCEETELCRNRVSKYFKILYYPEATVIHLVGKSCLFGDMHSQSMLSFALTWYKKGLGNYMVYLFSALLNIVSLLIAYFFAGENGRNDFVQQLRGYKTILPYLFFEIPKHSRKWGSRPEPLRLKSL